MANTSKYGWETPDDTDYVYQGAAAARTTANSIDTTLYSLTQKPVSYKIDTSSVVLASTSEALLMFSSAIVPSPNRLYQITITVGNIQKTTNAGTVFINFRKNGTSGTLIDKMYASNMAASEERPFSKTIILTSVELGTTAFTPAVCVQASTNGLYADNSGTGGYGSIIITDVGSY